MRKNDLVVAQGFASTDKRRPGVNGVRVEPGRLIAADGRRLIVVHESGDRKPPAEGETATLSLDSVATLAKRMLPAETVTIDSETGVATLGGAAFPCERQAVPFPDYLKVLPPSDREGDQVVRLDASYLKSFCEAATKTTDGRVKWIELRVGGKHSPVRIDGERIEGALMPIC